MPDKILWIEDDTDIIGDIVFPLREHGFIVNEVPSLATFIKNKGTLSDYVLTIVDLIIPQKDRKNKKALLEHPGIEVLRIIREEIKSDIPIIVLTVVKSEKVLNEVRKYKVADILFKPAKSSDLYATVLRSLNT